MCCRPRLAWSPGTGWSSCRGRLPRCRSRRTWRPSPGSPAIQVRAEGFGSALPAASTARTRKVCEPSDRFEYDLVELQLCHSAPSRRHSKPKSELGELKLKLTLPPLVPEGPESSEVVGGVV